MQLSDVLDEVRAMQDSIDADESLHVHDPHRQDLRERAIQSIALVLRQDDDKVWEMLVTNEESCALQCRIIKRLLWCGVPDYSALDALVALVERLTVEEAGRLYEANRSRTGA